MVVLETNGYLEQGLEGQQALPHTRKVSCVAGPRCSRTCVFAKGPSRFFSVKVDVSCSSGPCARFMVAGLICAWVEV